MPDAPAPAPAPEQELGQESGLRDLLTTLAGNVQSIQDRGIAAEAKLELLTGQINLVVNATNTNAEGLAKLQAFVAASKTADPAADPADLLDWPPHFGGRDENPFPTRPRGVTDRPQLFKLDQLSPVYDYLRKKGSAAYHEIGTDVPILSYLWDALFLFKDWLPTFAEAVDKTPDASKALGAIYNSVDECYNLLNRRRGVVELRATIESKSPSLVPSKEDKLLWEAIASKVNGFEKDLGIDASIDPILKKLLQEHVDASSKAKYAALAKSAGQAAAGGKPIPAAKPKRAPKPATGGAPGSSG